MFSWKLLHSTCATFGSNAAGVFGAAAAHASAKRCGHAVQVADRVYTGQVKVSRKATTLEQAMGIEAVMAKVFARAGGEHRGNTPVRAKKGGGE